MEAMAATRHPSGARKASPPSGEKLAVVDGLLADTDAELVRGTLAGSMESFEKLVARYEHPLYLHVWRIVRGREDAEDVVQEAFVRAYANLAGFDTHRPFRPWIYRIATNLAISQARKRRPVASLSNPEEGPARTLTDGKDGPRENAERQCNQQTLRRAIEKLPPETRALVALRYDEELAIDQIAEIVEKKPSAVKVALHRARLRLRDLIFGQEEQEEKQ